MHSFLKKFIRCFAVSAVLVPGVFSLAATETLAIDSIDMTGVALRFIYSSSDPLTGNSNPSGRSNGDVVVYRNVGTSVGGVSIDAVVTTQLAGASIGDYDNTGSASNSNAIAGTTAAHNFQVDMTTSSANGTATFSFDFYESGTWTGVGTGSTVTLRNVKVTSIDIDGSGSSDFQYVDLTGFQKYTTSNPTSIAVSSPATGVVRFKATDDSNGSNRPADRVQVSYDTMGRFSAVFGNVMSGKLGYYGLLFVVDAWNGCGCTTVETSNPFNSPPTSTSTSRYVTLGTPTLITLDDFGTYADLDYNPFESVKIISLPASGVLEFFNGASWVAVTANQVISVADIELGKVRFTGASSDSIGFKVFDGLALSAATYSITLNVATNAQTISFINPGTKPSGQTFSSGVTASSGLTPVLVSLTPGVCSVSGLSVSTLNNGVCSIKATQPGNSSWSTADPVTQTFSVSSLLGQTITFTNPGDKIWSGSTISISSGALASSGLTVTLVSFTPSVCTVSGLTISAVSQGTCRVKASQAGGGGYSPASPVEQLFLISSSVQSSTTTIAPTTTTTLAPTTTTTLAPSTTTTLAPSTTTSVAPSTSTTVPSSQTTIPINAGSQGNGSIQGIVWIDTNKDEKFTSGEPKIVDSEVRLTSASLTLTVRTNASGSYSFTSLTAGGYTVSRLSASAKGLLSAFDLDGNSDGSAVVTIASGESATADFAEIGSAKAFGKVVSEDGTTVAKTSVTCVWSGIDGVLGTNDDTKFAVKTNDAGMFSLSNVPSGKYQCGDSSSTGRGVRAKAFSLDSSTASDATSTKPTVVLTMSQALPVTGSDLRQLSRVMWMILLSGVSLVGIARRRRWNSLGA